MTHAGEISFQTCRKMTQIILAVYFLEIPYTQSGPHDCTLRSADIALIAGGNRKRWIIATENMQPEDIIKTSAVIGRMAGNTLHQR